jgi:hypothetical protein
MLKDPGRVDSLLGAVDLSTVGLTRLSGSNVWDACAQCGQLTGLVSVSLASGWGCRICKQCVAQVCKAEGEDE